LTSGDIFGQYQSNVPNCQDEVEDAHLGGDGCPANASADNETSSMQKLVKGIHQWHPVEFRPSHALFQLPSRGQGPETLLIACSDLGMDPYSLIPTNMVDLYLMQNFGNVVAPYDPRHPDVASSVETALALYPVKDIIICGHSPCDVIRNLLALDDRGDAETPDLANALRHAQRTRQVTAEHYRRLEGEPLLTAAIE
jgi:carbonic anhydrase